jgi:hypothetical protein
LNPHHPTPHPTTPRCTSGCQCNKARLEGHHALNQSQTFLLHLHATQSERCTITVTVDDASSSGGHKVKVGGGAGACWRLLPAYPLAPAQPSATPPATHPCAAPSDPHAPSHTHHHHHHLPPTAPSRYQGS